MENATIIPCEQHSLLLYILWISSININFLDMSVNFTSVCLTYLSVELIKICKKSD